jgi:hypothetical protein
VLGELAGDASPLGGRVDGDHVDLAGALRMVEDHVDEADRCAVVDCDPGVVAFERLPNRRRLMVLPVRVDAAVEVFTEHRVE